MDRNAAFRDHVTSAAFSLSLSKNMIAYLALIAAEDNPPDDEKAARGRSIEGWPSLRDRYVSRAGRYDPVGAGRALLSRGLIFAPYKDWPGIYCLTDAGRLVLDLLVLAGLVEKVEAPERDVA